MRYSYPLKENRAAVVVERTDKRAYRFKVVPGSVCLIREGTAVAERPEAKIFDEEGNEIKAIGRFLWSVETIDPFHLVTDMF